MTRARGLASVAVIGLAIALGGCAPPKPPALPSGSGTPFGEFAQAYRDATASCRQINTFTAVLALSGRAGKTRLRGRIEAGFAAPAKMRLEGIAPFGRPVFVLTATGGRGTLVLQREGRVLQDAAPREIVEALAGVPLGAEELRTAVTGCGLWTADAPAAGRTYAGGWAAVDLPGGTVYLRRVIDSWQMAAAVRGPLTVFYAEFTGRRPAAIRIRALSGGDVAADLTLRASQVDIDTPLGDEVFAADVPSDAEPLTLDELRRAGPLGRDE
jgi:hypothetical protein